LRAGTRGETPEIPFATAEANLPLCEAAVNSGVPSPSGTTCPPCGPLYCTNDPGLASAIAAKKAELRAQGYPDRLLNLLDRYKCIGCVKSAPDRFSIMIEYAPGHYVTDSTGTWSHMIFAWTAQDEALARVELRRGTIKSFSVFNSMQSCPCCGEKDPQSQPDYNATLDMNTGGMYVYQKPSDLGPDPPDLENIPANLLQQLPPIGTYTKPPRRQVHVMCPNCEALAEKYNTLAGQLDALWDSSIALQTERDTLDRQVIDRQNQIDNLQYKLNVSGYSYFYQPQIDELQKLNQADNATFSADYDKLQSVEQQIADITSQMAALEPLILQCEQTECPPPSPAQQCAPGSSGCEAPTPLSTSTTNPAKVVQVDQQGGPGIAPGQQGGAVGNNTPPAGGATTTTGGAAGPQPGQQTAAKTPEQVSREAGLGGALSGTLQTKQAPAAYGSFRGGIQVGNKWVDLAVPTGTNVTFTVNGSSVTFNWDLGTEKRSTQVHMNPDGSLSVQVQSELIGKFENHTYSYTETITDSQTVTNYKGMQFIQVRTASGPVSIGVTPPIFNEGARRYFASDGSVKVNGVLSRNETIDVNAILSQLKASSSAAATPGATNPAAGANQPNTSVGQSLSGKPQPYLEVKPQQVIITNVTPAGGTAEKPPESVNLNYAPAQLNYGKDAKSATPSASGSNTQSSNLTPSSTGTAAAATAQGPVTQPGQQALAATPEQQLSSDAGLGGAVSGTLQVQVAPGNVSGVYVFGHWVNVGGNAGKNVTFTVGVSSVSFSSTLNGSQTSTIVSKNPDGSLHVIQETASPGGTVNSYTQNVTDSQTVTNWPNGAQGIRILPQGGGSVLIYLTPPGPNGARTYNYTYADGKEIKSGGGQLAPGQTLDVNAILNKINPPTITIPAAAPAGGATPSPLANPLQPQSSTPNTNIVQVGQPGGPGIAPANGAQQGGAGGNKNNQQGSTQQTPPTGNSGSTAPQNAHVGPPLKVPAFAQAQGYKATQNTDGSLTVTTPSGKTLRLYRDASGTLQTESATAAAPNANQQAAPNSTPANKDSQEPSISLSDLQSAAKTSGMEAFPTANGGTTPLGGAISGSYDGRYSITAIRYQNQDGSSTLVLLNFPTGKFDLPNYAVIRRLPNSDRAAFESSGSFSPKDPSFSANSFADNLAQQAANAGHTALSSASPGASANPTQTTKQGQPAETPSSNSSLDTSAFDDEKALEQHLKDIGKEPDEAAIRNSIIEQVEKSLAEPNTGTPPAGKPAPQTNPNTNTQSSNLTPPGNTANCGVGQSCANTTGTCQTGATCNQTCTPGTPGCTTPTSTGTCQTGATCNQTCSPGTAGCTAPTPNGTCQPGPSCGQTLNIRNSSNPPPTVIDQPGGPGIAGANGAAQQGVAGNTPSPTTTPSQQNTGGSTQGKATISAQADPVARAVAHARAYSASADAAHGRTDFASDQANLAAAVNAYTASMNAGEGTAVAHARAYSASADAAHGRTDFASDQANTAAAVYAYTASMNAGEGTAAAHARAYSASADAAHGRTDFASDQANLAAAVYAYTASMNAGEGTAVAHARAYSASADAAHGRTDFASDQPNAAAAIYAYNASMAPNQAGIVGSNQPPAPPGTNVSTKGTSNTTSSAQSTGISQPGATPGEINIVELREGPNGPSIIRQVPPQPAGQNQPQATPTPTPTTGTPSTGASGAPLMGGTKPAFTEIPPVEAETPIVDYREGPKGTQTQNAPAQTGTAPTPGAAGTNVSTPPMQTGAAATPRTGTPQSKGIIPGGGGSSPGDSAPPDPPALPPAPFSTPSPSVPSVPGKALPKCLPVGTDRRVACQEWLDIWNANKAAAALASQAVTNAQNDLNQAPALDAAADAWNTYSQQLNALSDNYAAAAKTYDANAAAASPTQSAQWQQLSADAGQQARDLFKQSKDAADQSQKIKQQADGLRARLDAAKADAAAKTAAADASWLDYQKCLGLPDCPQGDNPLNVIGGGIPTGNPNGGSSGGSTNSFGGLLGSLLGGTGGFNVLNNSLFGNASGAPAVQNIVITINIKSGAGAPAVTPGQGALQNGSRQISAMNRRQPAQPHARVRPAAYRLGSPTRAPSRGLPAARLASHKLLASLPSAEGLTFSIASNGNLGSNALEFRVHDPSGRLKGNVSLPEGMVLEPLKMGTPNPAGNAAGGSNVAQPLTAYCLEMAKLPPEVGQLYRLAPQAVQQKYLPIHSVLQAGSKLAAAGKFHPDSDPTAYADFIRQHALWAQLENWSEQKFTEVFLERTKKNAEHLNVKWTNEMTDALRAAAPGRWRDIAMVLDEAHKLSAAAGAP
jgi:hypothetical protein